MKYGDTLVVTTGDKAIDEMIGLTCKDASKLPVGKYAFSYLVDYNRNYRVAETWADADSANALTIEPREATLVVKNYSKTYDGKTVKTSAIKASVVGAVNGDKPAITITVNGGKTMKNAGTYTVTAVANDSNYIIEKQTAKVTIKQAAQAFKSVKPLTKSYTAAALKKAKKTFTIKATLSKGNGKVTFKKASGSKYLSITSAGKVTVKKGTYKKGTKLTMKVKVTAAKTTNYKAKTVTKTIQVTVK